MKLAEMQVDAYIDLVASEEPAPGGGSTSALSGAQGAALIAMVTRLTSGKAKFADYKPLCDEIMVQTDKIAKELTAQVDIDSAAYGRIADAFKLPKETDEDKAARRAAIADATLYATEVPFHTMELAVAGLECAERLMGSFNTNCASDLGCAALGLVSCVKGAWMNVLINVGGVKDEEKAAAFQREGEAMVAKAERISAKLYDDISALCKG